MSNDTKNRAQRRRAERDQRVHHPSFWDKPLNKIIVGVLAAGFIGVVIYAALPKGSTTKTAKSAVTTPTPPPSQPVTPPPPASNTAATNTAVPPVDPNAKVEQKDLKVGTGTETVALGDTITVHYTGTLTDGTKFDSSVDKGTPYTFKVGTTVIDGWTKGVIGMKKGGKRKLTIPPSLGYGASGSPPRIPPNATLLFDIEVLKIEKAKK